MRTRYVRVLNALCLVVLVGMSLFLALSWEGIPQQVPGHFDAAGQIDRWTGKGTLLLLPASAWALYGGLTLVERNPRWWSTGVEVTAQNRERVYSLLAGMLAAVKALLTAILAAQALCQILGRPLPSALLPAELLAVFGVVLYFLVRLFRIR